MGIELPLILYAASKAYRTRQDQNAYKKRLEAENTITNYGYSVDANGKRIGGLKKLDANMENVEATHFRLGSGDLKEIQVEQNSVPYYFNKTTGVKGTAAEFAERKVDVMSDRGNFSVVGNVKPGGEISMFSNWDKGINFTKPLEDFDRMAFLDADEDEYPDMTSFQAGVNKKRKANPDFPLFGQKVFRERDADGLRVRV